ncbi:hypothetical protein F4678DRAFT_486231 [Xylaria arbuscula]|nr:hypothetical protein F4678DRAFT_486231 [Xylaria arbuscula]
MGTLAWQWPSPLRNLARGLRKQLTAWRWLQATSIPSQNDFNDPSSCQKHKNKSGVGSEKKQSTRRSLSRWKWEIMGMVLSILSFAASIVLLAVYNGQRVDSWNAPFTLNTFLSILAQTSRTLLAFGVGSSLGQAKWNIFTKGHGELESFVPFAFVVSAAVITTLLGYEPSVQASITQFGKLDGELSSSGPKASISRAERLDIGSLTAINYINSMDYRGIYTSDMTTMLPYFTCPTGNCTFGNFASLGVCSSCVDVSSHLEKKTDPGDKYLPLPSSTTYNLPWPDDPASLYISHLDTFRNSTYPDLLDNAVLPWTVVSESNVERTHSFNNTVNGTTFLVLGILYPHSDYANNISAWNATGPKAAECGLYYCTNVYSSFVVDGVLNETLVASVSNRAPDSYQAYGRTPSYDEWRPHALYQYMDSPRSDLQLFISDVKAKLLGLRDGQPLKFNISQATIRLTTNLLESTFGGRAYPDSVYPDDDLSTSIDRIIAESKDLNATFRAIAASLTFYMRDQEYNSSAYYGVPHQWVLHYYIRWEFLLAPLGLTIAGCFFLLYTIWETQSLGLMAWKESTLATLAHGLDALTRAKMREAYLDNTEEKSARDILVRAEKFRGGIELCEAHPGDVSGPSPQRDPQLV